MRKASFEQTNFAVGTRRRQGPTPARAKSNDLADACADGDLYARGRECVSVNGANVTRERGLLHLPIQGSPFKGLKLNFLQSVLFCRSVRFVACECFSPCLLYTSPSPRD